MCPSLPRQALPALQALEVLSRQEAHSCLVPGSGNSLGVAGAQGGALTWSLSPLQLDSKLLRVLSRFSRTPGHGLFLGHDGSGDAS